MKNVSINDFASYNLPSGINYDRKHNVILYQTTNWTNEHIRPVFKSFMLDLNTNTTTKISAGGYNESTPNILDDGSYLLLSNKDNKDYDRYLPMRDIRKYFIANQLYKITDDKVTKLTNFLHGVESYALSPDKTKVLLTVKYYDGDDPAHLNYRYTAKQLKKVKEDIVLNPIIITENSFKSDGDLGYKDKSKSTLYLLDLTTNKLKHLPYPRFIAPAFDLDNNIYFYHFGKQGKLVIYRNNKPFIECNNVKPNPGSRIVFNKDYTRILLAVQKLNNGFNQPVDIICLANKKQQDLEAEFVFTIDDEIEEGSECDCGNFPMSYSSQASYCFTDKDDIIFSRGVMGNVNLFKTSKDLKTTELIIGDNHNFKGLVNYGNDEILALHTTSTETTQYVKVNTLTKAMETVSDFNAFLKEANLVKAESFNSNISGWVMKPVNYKPNEKYPTLLVVHGGPNGHYCSGFSLEMQSYVANGFAVIYANPVGSSGYGKKHADMGPAFEDEAMNQLIEYCRKASEKYPFIDVDRIGITGGSYGGFETIYACGHSDFFKAGAALRPLGNFLMIANCSHSAGNENTLENYPDDYVQYISDYIKQSPNSYADKIKVPFLMGAHEKDANCIPAQMVQLFKLLKTIHPDLPVKLVLTPDSNHGLYGIGPLPLAQLLRNEVIDWFKMYL